ncbi:MAG: DegT/DnrJ/EryC1/StrS family aminotransferase [Vicinamibacterales bacterium]
MSATTPVPLLDLSAQYAPLREQLLATITRVCDSQRFIMGPEITSLESELATRIGVKHAVAVSSGTDALLLALMALDIGPGDEVVTTTYSFFATAGAISRVGATPVLVDIDPVTYNLDPEALAAAITPRTKAVLPVHLYGLCADMDAIVAIANRAGVPIIEDAAQAIGSIYKGSPAGGMGAFGCFSFFPSKNLGAFGDAGLVTTNDPALAKKAQLLRMHGMEPKYIHQLIGGNFRCDALQAAILRVKAPHLAAWTEARRLNARRYATLFRDAGLLDRMVLPVEPQGSYHIYNQYVVRVPRRNELKAFLDARGIGNEVYYPVPFHLQPCFAGLGYARGAFPHAELAADQTIAIPIYSELSLDQQRTVVNAIAQFLGTNGVASPPGAGR